MDSLLPLSAHSSTSWKTQVAADSFLLATVPASVSPKGSSLLLFAESHAVGSVGCAQGNGVDDFSLSL